MKSPPGEKKKENAKRRLNKKQIIKTPAAATRQQTAAARRMGTEQSTGRKAATFQEAEQLNTFPAGLDIDRDSFSGNALVCYKVTKDDDPELEIARNKLLGPAFSSAAEDRAFGCMFGMPIGDSLGAPLEFSAVRYGSTELQDMPQDDVWFNPRYNRFRLRPGQWTDDSAMGFCIADSLLVHHGFDGRDLRLRFLNWWELGYNNAFGQEFQWPEDLPPNTLPAMGRTSVGLGGNISQSFGEFQKHRLEFTTAGDRRTSGNGSIMRLAPVPIYYWDNIENAMDVAAKSSRTTHQGDEAAECCRLLAYICVRAMNHPSSDAAQIRQEVLDDLSGFSSNVYSIQCLAASKQEEPHEDNEGAKLQDRNWNWKDGDFRYSPSRAREQPGYVGSYAMDNMAMSLHCVYSTTSFRDAVLKAANVRGDSDSVASVVGQIAGAIYGASSIPKHWIECVQQWDRGTIALRAYKLFHKTPL